MGIIPAFEDEQISSAIDAAIHALDSGSVIAVPSDTGYALIADVSYTGAADRLFALKMRSRDFELPMIVSDIDQALSLSVGVPESAQQLMEKLWPGALTLIVPRHPDFVADLGSDDETVAVRCPGHLIPRLLCDEVGPLATTSSNISGSTTHQTAKEVTDTFGDHVAVVLDGGVCDGSPATVVDSTGETPKLLREGSVSWTEILSVLG